MDRLLFNRGSRVSKLSQLTDNQETFLKRTPLSLAQSFREMSAKCSKENLLIFLKIHTAQLPSRFLLPALCNTVLEVKQNQVLVWFELATVRIQDDFKSDILLSQPLQCQDYRPKSQVVLNYSKMQFLNLNTEKKNHGLFWYLLHQYQC